MRARVVFKRQEFKFLQFHLCIVATNCHGVNYVEVFKINTFSCLKIYRSKFIPS